MNRDYLRDEFYFITNKIAVDHPYRKDALKLLHENTSLDEVFSHVCVPVLLTYDSETVKKNTKVCERYIRLFEEEVNNHYESFRKKKIPNNVIVHLFLLPLKSKDELAKAFDERLKNLQASLL
jgi:hypothetical protein